MIFCECCTSPFIIVLSTYISSTNRFYNCNILYNPAGIPAKFYNFTHSSTATFYSSSGYDVVNSTTVRFLLPSPALLSFLLSCVDSLYFNDDFVVPIKGVKYGELFSTDAITSVSFGFSAAVLSFSQSISLALLNSPDLFLSLTFPRFFPFSHGSSFTLR
jgi:hypothetical protein